MEFLSKDTILSVSETATGVFKQLYGMNSTPDMGGDTDSVEITNLSDGSKRYIDGLKDPGDMEFGFYVNTKDESQTDVDKAYDAYKTLREYQNAGKKVYYKLVYPDGYGFAWRGSVSVKRGGAEVGSALSFTLTTRASTDITDITPDSEQKANIKAGRIAQTVRPANFKEESL